EPGPVNLTFGGSVGGGRPIDSLRSEAGEPLELLVEEGLDVSGWACPLGDPPAAPPVARAQGASGRRDAAHATMTFRFAGRLQSFRGRLANRDGSPHVTMRAQLTLAWKDDWERSVDAEERAIVGGGGEFRFTCWLHDSAW